MGTTKTMHAKEIFSDEWIIPEDVKSEIDNLVMNEGVGLGLQGMEIAT